MARHFFERPQSPLPENHALTPEFVAESVVREVSLALGLARFPEKRWADWLARRAHALYRLHRRFRARLNGPQGRGHCAVCMRHWLYIALHKTRWRYATVLPETMWSGHAPTRGSLTPWKIWRLPAAARRRRVAG
ncbi:MAG: hypothetical protein RLZZ15_1888 [Verrucomicrobiota bacterium]